MMDGQRRPWRPCAAAGVVLALMGSGLVAGAPQGREPGPPATAEPSARERLARRITVDVQEQPLEDVVRFLEEVTGVRMEPVWREDTLEAGLERDSLITVSASNEPALVFLERVLARAGDPLDASTWQFSQGGVLQFGPRSALNRLQQTVVYDINDLLLAVPDFDDSLELDLESVLNQAEGGQAGGAIVETEASDSAPPRPTRTERAEEVAALLTSLIEPEQWVRNGGGGASVRIYGGTLLVRAPGYIHRQIQGE